MEQGEKCTKFFMNLNDRGRVRKNMTKIVKLDGSVAIDPKEVLGQQEELYAYICNCKDPPMSIDVFVLFFPQPPPASLSHDEYGSCESLVAEGEFKKAIKQFSPRKSPGLDGLPVEFHKVIFHSLKQPFLASFN